MLKFQKGCWMMRIDVLTLFPKMVEGPLGESIIGKAIEKGYWRSMSMIFERIRGINICKSTIIHMVEAQVCC